MTAIFRPFWHERGTPRLGVADRLLTMSILGPYSTAVMLVSVGLLLVLVPLNVPGFCPVLARGWHGHAWLLVTLYLQNPHRVSRTVHGSASSNGSQPPFVDDLSASRWL